MSSAGRDPNETSRTGLDERTVDRDDSGCVIARSVLPTEAGAIREFVRGMRGAIHVRSKKARRPSGCPTSARVRRFIGGVGIRTPLVKAIRYAKVNTDRVDGRMLAQLLRAGLFPEAHMIGASIGRGATCCARACRW